MINRIKFGLDDLVTTFLVVMYAGMAWAFFSVCKRLYDCSDFNRYSMLCVALGIIGVIATAVFDASRLVQNEPDVEVTPDIDNQQ